MKFFCTFILLAILLPLCPAKAQGSISVERDSVSQDVISLDLLALEKKDSINIPADSTQSGKVVKKSELLGRQLDSMPKGNNKPAEFKPNPSKAVLYSAIFPGLGQIYNRKYWKLPIVYGGFIGCAYAITWNSTQYGDYKQAYHDIADDDKTTNSWQNYLPYGVDPSTLTKTQMDNYTNAFKNKKDFYRRNRDLSIIVTVGLYALCMLDSYVDAQLFDFDISPDLSMRVEPVIYNKSEFNSRSVGLQCSIKF